MAAKLHRHEIRRGDVVTFKPVPGVHLTAEELDQPRRVASITLIRAYEDRHLPKSRQRVVSRYARLEGAETLTSVEYLTKID